MKPRHLIIGGAIGMVIGALMPWASLNVGFASVSVNGTAGDGQIVLVAGILVLVLALVRSGTVGTVFIGLAGLAGLGTAIYDAANLTSTFEKATAESSFVHGSIGSGLWIAMLASASVLAGVGWMIQNASDRRIDAVMPPP